MTMKINQTTPRSSARRYYKGTSRCDCQCCQRVDSWAVVASMEPFTALGASHHGGMQRNSRQAGRLSHGSSRHHDGGQSSRKARHPHCGADLRGGTAGEAELLASCYRESLRLAVEHSIKTIAFPSISTGVYGYPVAQAAPIALNAVKQFLEAYDGLDDVRFVLFDDATYGAYENALADMGV